MKKVILSLLALCFATNVFAATKEENELAEVSYCYGVYEAVRSSEEVEKMKELLSSVPQEKKENTYLLLTDSESYKEGYKEGKLLSKKEQGKCVLVAYGFLAVAEVATQKAPAADKIQRDFAYCMGYEDTARDGNGFIMNLCSDLLCRGATTENPNCSDECYEALKNEAMENSEAFAKGVKDAAEVDPAQMMVCVVSLAEMSDDEEEMKKNFISIWPEMAEIDNM